MPEEVKKEIRKIQEKLPKVNLKLVKPGKSHLTLKFFKNLSEEEVEKVKEKLGNLKFDKFKVETGKIGVFNPNFIKVIWLGLNAEKLKELKKRIDKLLIKDKRFSSHITIARVKSLSGMKRKEFLGKLNEIRSKKISFEVDKIKLKKSVLKEEGPKYEDLFVKNLSRF